MALQKFEVVRSCFSFPLVNKKLMKLLFTQFAIANPLVTIKVAIERLIMILLLYKLEPLTFTNIK